MTILGPNCGKPRPVLPRARRFRVAQGQQPAVRPAGTPLAAEGTGQGRAWMGERTMTVHIWYMRVACNLRPIGIALRDNKGVDTGLP